MEIDSVLSKIFKTPKILKFNNGKQDSDKIFARFFQNLYQILTHSVTFLVYGEEVYHDN